MPLQLYRSPLPSDGVVILPPLVCPRKCFHHSPSQASRFARGRLPRWPLICPWLTIGDNPPLFGPQCPFWIKPDPWYSALCRPCIQVPEFGEFRIFKNSDGTRVYGALQHYVLLSAGIHAVKLLRPTLFDTEHSWFWCLQWSGISARVAACGCCARERDFRGGRLSLDGHGRGSPPDPRTDSSLTSQRLKPRRNSAPVRTSRPGVSYTIHSSLFR